MITMCECEFVKAEARNNDVDNKYLSLRLREWCDCEAEALVRDFTFSETKVRSDHKAS